MKSGRWTRSISVRFRRGKKISWLRWIDEYSGAVLGTVVFPFSTFGQVPASEVGNALRRQFLRWGMPVRLRVDNGLPWGNWNDLPTPFALWVVGLGVDWHWNDPGCPQQNPKIERSQGTGKRWAEPRQCGSVSELQERVDEADQNQREYYRLRGGVTRMEMHPELRHSGYTYTRAWERRHWSLQRIEEHLSEYVATRKVSSSGHVRVYYANRYVGKQFIGQVVKVQYDPDAHEWLIADRHDQEIRRHPAPEISRGEIVKMNFRPRRTGQEKN